MFSLCCLCSVKMEDLDLPEIKRKKIQEKKAEDKKEFKDLFQSDSESDEDDGGLKIKGKLTLAHTHSHVEIGLLRSSGNYDGSASRGLCFVKAWCSAVQS